MEQNILLKAHQKRKLDSMVISKGHFSAESLFSVQTLKSAFGVPESDMPTDTGLSHLMYDVEDEDDRKALSAFKIEVEEDKKEFEEASSIGTENLVKTDEELDEVSNQLELSALLKPVDIYALTVSENSVSQNTIFSNFETSDIESNLTDDSKELEDTDSDLVISSVTACTDLVSLSRWYAEERKKNLRLRLLRRLQGLCWKKIIVDSISYWFNEDTGELCYETPEEIKRKEDFEESLKRKFNFIPFNVLIHIFKFLKPLPDRAAAQRCCSRWHRASAEYEKFALFVTAMDRQFYPSADGKFFATIGDALKAALPGDLIILSPGHHWISGSHTITFPVKIMAEDDGSFIEVNGKIVVVNASVVMMNINVRLHTIDSCFAFQRATCMVRVSSCSMLFLTSTCSSTIANSSPKQLRSMQLKVSYLSSKARAKVEVTLSILASHLYSFIGQR